MSIKLKILFFGPMVLGMIVLAGILLTVEDPQQRFDWCLRAAVIIFVVVVATSWSIIIHNKAKKPGVVADPEIASSSDAAAKDWDFDPEELSPKSGFLGEYKFGKWERTVLA